MGWQQGMVVGELEKENKKRKWAIALGFGLGYCLGPWFEPTNRGEKWAKLG